MRLKWIGLVLAGALSSGAAPIIVNGSFETPVTNVGAFQRLFSPSSVITGWTVSANDVDWIGTLWQNSDGNRSLDMSGAASGGTIRQDVDGFTAGLDYELLFDLAGNPFTNAAKQLQVTVFNGASSVASATFTFIQTGHTLVDMGWGTRSLAFTAPVSGILRLQFTGLNNDGSGAALDNVRLVETAPSTVPEPGSLALLGASLGALALRRRRK